MKQLVLVVATVLMSLTLNAQLKIAHVNSKSLLDSLPSYKKAQSDLLKGQDSAYYELGEKQKQIEDKYKELNQKKNSLSPMALQTMENEILNMEQGAQQIQSYWTDRLQNREQEYLQPILNRLQESIEKVAKKKGFELCVGCD